MLLRQNSSVPAERSYQPLEQSNHEQIRLLLSETSSFQHIPIYSVFFASFPQTLNFAEKKTLQDTVLKSNQITVVNHLSQPEAGNLKNVAQKDFDMLINILLYMIP